MPSETRALWHTAVSPTARELEELLAELGLPESAVAHALDPHERPRSKSFDGFTFLVLRVPFVGRGASARLCFETVPLVVFRGPRGGLVTCTRECETIRSLEEYVSSRPDADTASVFFRALELTAEAFLTQLDELERAVDATEQELGAALENRGVLELLEYQKSLVHYTAALEGALVVAERIPETLATYDAARLADVKVELRQARDTATLQRDVLAEMMDAFASIISNNLNFVMKFLAAITVILTVPMLVASFYGMNVALPGQTSAYAFAGTIVASVVLGLAVAAVFRRHGWL